MVLKNPVFFLKNPAQWFFLSVLVFLDFLFFFGFFNANPDARHNVYFSKKYAYDPPQAVVRACLTVIDHNRNVDRKPRKDRDGDDKVVSVTTRDGQDSKERTIMEDKNTIWRQEIMAEVLQVGKM